jgi:hypothetical protein
MWDRSFQAPYLHGGGEGNGVRGGQVVEIPRYKPEGRGFSSRWGQTFRPHYGPRVDSASYTEMSIRDPPWGVKATGV